MTVSDAPPEEYISTARIPLERLRPFACELWRGARGSLAAVEAPAFLERAVRYTGARLIQAAYEANAAAFRLTKDAVATLQLATNILAAPTEASLDLLGLPLESSP